MQAMDAKEMESSSKIDLRNVTWWMTIKKAYRPEVPIIAKFSKERCISLTTRRSFRTTCKYDLNKRGPLQLEKYTPPNWAY
jgi:hypothetical protein